MTSIPLQAVLVDIDGTLIDSNDAHARAWMSVLKRHGRPQPFDAVRPLIGMGGDKLLGTLLGVAPGAPEVESLGDEQMAAFLETELHALKPTRGARDLLERLHAAGLRVVVATSASRGGTAALLRQAGVDDLIDEAATSSDATETKPEPDIVHAALRRAGLRPSQSVMLGDTPYDIEAAGRAGVPTIALRCGGWWNDDVFADAAAIYDDPAHLLRAFGDSPLAAALQRTAARAAQAT